MTKIEDTFEYHSQLSKSSFQQTVTSLVELHQYLTGKIRQCKASNKKGLFISVTEAELLADDLFSRISDLISHYDAIDRVNTLLHKRQRMTEAITFSHMDTIQKALKALNTSKE